MPVHAVIAKNPDPELGAAVQRTYPDSYRWTDGFFLIRSSDTAKIIGSRLGIKTRTEDGGVAGSIGDAAILSLSPSYWGWAPSDMWEWMQAAFQREH